MHCFERDAAPLRKVGLGQRAKGGPRLVPLPTGEFRSVIVRLSANGFALLFDDQRSLHALLETKLNGVSEATTAFPPDQGDHVAAVRVVVPGAGMRAGKPDFQAARVAAESSIGAMDADEIETEINGDLHGSIGDPMPLLVS
ncbi:hypothetical protein N825_27150 [Skermanella stibiiresistens SB22]|uniref:Uncharacterized protein n=1 Tax=Skermanella stibiiresistens SB22 TaxID=1385369 RepID=W9GR93_9PROT|nr:hypothetical protein N825_27150 [Skermanella stibiiresistens SB22]